MRQAVVEQPNAIGLQVQEPPFDAEPRTFVGDQRHVQAMVFVPVLRVVDVRENPTAFRDATQPGECRLDREGAVQELEQARQARQVRLIDGMTIRQLAARIARALTGAQQREARFDMPLPLALEPLGLLRGYFFDQRCELELEWPPGESIWLFDSVMTAFVRPLKHEPQRSKSVSTAIPRSACGVCGVCRSRYFFGRMNGQVAAPSHRLARDEHW